MLKKCAKNVLRYAVGVTLIAIGIALNEQHAFGQGPFDQMNDVISQLIGISLGTMIMISNFTLLVIYFLAKKNKDFWIPILAIFLLGNVVNFFNDVIFADLAIYDKSIFVRVAVAILTLNVLLIGVIFTLKSELSPLPFDLLNKLVNEIRPFNKLSFGVVRMFLDATCILIAFILTIILLYNFDISNFIFPLVLVITGGPLLNIYLKGYNKIFSSRT